MLEPDILDDRIEPCDRVDAWRLERLIDAGYSVELAVQLATAQVDLHQACDLLARGCTPELAGAILL